MLLRKKDYSLRKVLQQYASHLLSPLHTQDLINVNTREEYEAALLRLL